MRSLRSVLILITAAGIAFLVGWLGQRTIGERGVDLEAWALLTISVALGAGLLIRAAVRRMREPSRQ